MRRRVPPAVLRALGALAAGALAFTGFEPLSWELFTGLGLMALFWIAARTDGPLEAALVGWLGGMGCFLPGFAWVYPALAVTAGIPAPLAVLGPAGMAAACSLAPAAALSAARALPMFRPLRLAFAMPALWTLAEWLRGDLVFGFGWLSAGYAFVQTPLAAWAPVLGVYGVTFVTALLAGGLTAALTMKTRGFLKPCIAMLCGAAALATFSLEGVHWSRPLERLEVRVVQPDLPVVMGLSRGEALKRVETAAAMSRSPAMGSHIDFIVWPESVYLIPWQKSPAAMKAAAEEVARLRDTTVLFNAFSEPEPGVWRNSVWKAEASGSTEIYAKRHLVPFGERAPFGLRAVVNAMGIPMADQTAGTDESLRAVPAGEKSAVALAVCYENLFPEELRAWWSKDNPGLVLASANLGWFAPQALAQYTQISAMRARETARPVLQVMNNAGSALIGPGGRVLRAAGEGAQTVDLQAQTWSGEPTPFVRFGHAGVLLLALVLLAAGLLLGRLERRARTAPENA